MTRKTTVFADRIVGIAVHNGLVRLDLAVFAGPAAEGSDPNKVSMTATHQLVLPLDAFMAGVALQEGVARELLARRRQRTEEAQQTAAAQPPAAQTALTS